MTTNAYPLPAGQQRSQGALTVDNVFRRMLKVANPRDPDEVAKALLSRYADDAQKIRREQQGVPLSSYQLAEMAGQVAGPLSTEIRQATDDLERDLGALVSDIQLKDIAPELRGLANSVRDAATMGLAAAKLALDPAQRDRAFAARRTLGDYARLTRLLGAVTACATALYCRVSQSIDMCSNIILVSAGEALAGAGVTKSGGLLQVPAAELQSRRDAIVGSLRRLMGVEGDVIIALSNVLNQQSTGPSPGAAGALALVMSELEDSGAQDLRALLDEGFVSGLLDNLLDHAVATTPDSLRSIGSTAVVTSGMLVRFVDLIEPLTIPANGARTLEQSIILDYVIALKSFSAGFQASKSGYRLPFLARPPLLGYGFYGTGGVDTATSMLQTLAVKRSQIAELVDCLCCVCTENSAVAAAIAAKLLFDLDRAIDLFCLGDAGDAVGVPELHAAAYGYIYHEASRADFNRTRNPRWSRGAVGSGVLVKALPTIKDALADVEKLLLRRGAVEPEAWGIRIPKHGGTLDSDEVEEILRRVLTVQRQDEERWRQLALAWSPICDQAAILAKDGPIKETGVGFIIDMALKQI